MSCVAWVHRFAGEAEKLRAQGIHLGSNNIQAAVTGQFYDRPGHALDPKLFHLQTQTEVKLIGKLIGDMVKPVVRPTVMNR